MDQGRVKLDLCDLFSLLPKCAYSSCKDEEIASSGDEMQDFTINELDRMESDKNLFESVWRDDRGQLVYLSKRLSGRALNSDDSEGQENIDQESMDRSVMSRLLQISCKLDSVECATALIDGEIGLAPQVDEMDKFGRTALHNAAEMHATKCIELLLRKQARSDLKSKDGNAHLPLEMALYSKRMQVHWNPDEPIEDLLVPLSKMDLSAIRMLAEKTRNLVEVAYVSAMDGRIVSLAALLTVAADRVNASIMVLRRDVGSKEMTTIYECVIREALSLGPTGSSSRAARRLCTNSNEKRKLMLCEIELLQLFGAVVHTGCSDRKVTSPLIRASQTGDEPVVKLLLNSKIDVNAVDGEGNTALHWCLRTSSNSKQPRVMCLLLKHGARVNQRNKLGLTPVHVAATNGNIQALQILLHKDPGCVDAASEMKETPLFFAVKNNFIDCAQLLLCYGASSQVFNLRRQRPIDFAKSDDMRFLLSSSNLRFWRRAFRTQEKSTFWLDNHLFDTETFDECLKVTEVTTERFYSNPKTEICRYFESPGGCVRGAKCYFAHGEEELQRTKSHLAHCLPSEEMKRKIFIGGLPPTVDSEILGDFFEDQFGPVEDAIVIGNPAGDHVHSRGFGFVKFKDENSVTAAVQAHYVTIMGKQVEIKGAVPKSILLAAVTKLAPRQQQQQHQDHQSQTQMQLLMPIEKNTDESKSDSMSWLQKLLEGKQRNNPNEPEAQVTPSSRDQNIPSWVATFKKWLPGFLQEVSKRLKEGEWYPLSSLKGDFRATCGLELDHTSLGYLKLSDFMRSFPNICRMKVVPVGGRGPATHMVLLPNLPKPHQHQVLPVTEPLLSAYTPPFHGDDDAGFSFLKSLLSTSYGDLLHSSSCLEEEGSSGLASMLAQEAKYTMPSVDPRFLTFLEPDPLFLARPWLKKGGNRGERDGGGGSGGGGGESGGLGGRGGGWGEGEADNPQQQHRQVVLEALVKKKGNTSVFFLREYDFQKSYRENLASKMCFGCDMRMMFWANHPCLHLLWCNECWLWAERQGATSHHKCVICDAEVKNFFFKAWEQHQQASEANNEEEFPPWDPNAVRTRQKKRASLEVP